MCTAELCFVENSFVYFEKFPEKGILRVIGAIWDAIFKITKYARCMACSPSALLVPLEIVDNQLDTWGIPFLNGDKVGI